jgi:hypothetical protein
MKLDPSLSPITKINSKWLRELNIRTKTMKLLIENIREMLHDIEVGKDVFNKTPKHKKQKQK